MAARTDRWNIARWGRCVLAVVALGAAGGAVACAAVGRYPEAPDLPVRVIKGRHPGPTVAFVAGVHGGKRAAVGALDTIAAHLNARALHGTVLLVGPANRAGYLALLAQVSPDDSLNLNRVFPGNATGRPTERLAARIMREIVAKSDYIIDLHGSDGEEAVGSFAYVARPRLDARVDSLALWLAEAWRIEVIVRDEDGPRTLAESRFLQTAAHLSGVPAITVFERGDTRDDDNATRRFADGALGVVQALNMMPGRILRHVDPRARASQHLVLPRRAVHTAASDGWWRTAVSPSAQLAATALLGTLTFPDGRVDSLRTPVAGVVLHQRLPGPVTQGTPLIILGVLPDSSPTPGRTP